VRTRIARGRSVRSLSPRRALLAVAVFGVWLGILPAARADIGSDHPAAILVFPKLLVDTTNGLDTLIRISNVSDTALNVYCFYVNATPQCSLGDGTSCFPDEPACFRDVGGQTIAGKCEPQWQPTDFIFRLTQDQPTGWLVSSGESVNCAFIDGVCSDDGTTRCDKDTDCKAGARCVQPACLPLDGGPLGRTGPGGQVNEGAVPLSPEDPFIGELKCIAVDDAQQPVARNDLIGEVLIGRLQSGPDKTIALAGYNAIGIPALLNTCGPDGKCVLTGTACQSDLTCEPTNNRDRTLVLGGAVGTAEYEGCPNILILDHYFDGAADPLIANLCEQPAGTCSVTGATCASDSDCIDNICVGGPVGTCSVTNTPCSVQTDCNNTCGPGNTCTLSGDRCLKDVDCPVPTFEARVVTELTLVPCTEDFEDPTSGLLTTTAQFIVFNEFEQRFSTSRSIDCFKEIQLSNIDTVTNERSIFSAGVQGTLTGQSRIRGVVPDDSTGRGGNALIGVAEEFRCAGSKIEFPTCGFTDAARMVSATAKNLHFQGRRPQSDFIYLPATP
jgi:hypothetical protein